MFGPYVATPIAHNSSIVALFTAASVASLSRNSGDIRRDGLCVYWIVGGVLSTVRDGGNNASLFVNPCGLSDDNGEPSAAILDAKRGFGLAKPGKRRLLIIYCFLIVRVGQQSSIYLLPLVGWVAPSIVCASTSAANTTLLLYRLLALSSPCCRPVTTA